MTNANNFLKYCFGIALVAGTLLFGSAALIYSSSPATAAHPSTEYGSGKYMMSMNTVIDESGYSNWYIIVWDTETGRSKMYYGSAEKGSIGAAGSAFNLPSTPL